jgi:hypothetical protein
VFIAPLQTSLKKEHYGQQIRGVCSQRQKTSILSHIKPAPVVLINYTIYISIAYNAFGFATYAEPKALARTMF